MADIPDKFLDLLTQKKAFAHLATVMTDGSPQVTPVWVDYSGGKLRVNSARGRVKTRNMTQGSKVALAISDPDNPYRYMQIRGTIVESTEKGANDVINRLAKKYIDKDVYPWGSPDEVRITYKVRPEQVQTMG